jgi:hypothetical protein
VGAGRMAIAAPGWTALPLRAALGGSGAMVVSEGLGMAAGLDRSRGEGRGATQVCCRERDAGILDSAVCWEAWTVSRCWGIHGGWLTSRGFLGGQRKAGLVGQCSEDRGDPVVMEGSSSETAQVSGRVGAT